MGIPKLSEEEIREYIGDRSFERGYGYFKNGAIFDARRQGMALKACCEGSQPQPYLAKVTFVPSGLESTCSCPVGTRCKHVTALLLTWLHNPDEFREVEELESALERKNKGELIALIKKMLLRKPELETLLEKTSREHISVETYRRQAAAAFRYQGWGAEMEIASDLRNIIVIGEEFAEQGDHADAAIVYEAVSQEILDHYEMFRDEEGELGNVLCDCVTGLGDSLGAIDDAATRDGILRSLFDIYHFDVDMGGMELGDEVPGIVLKHANCKECRAVAGWVQTAASSVDKWGRQKFGSVLLELKKEELDDETFLSICREMGLLERRIERLLRLKRLDEAIADAKEAGDYDLVKLADIFEEYGHGDVAERLTAERNLSSKDTRIAEWLKTHYEQSGELKAAVDASLHLFEMSPNLPNYKEVRRLAQQLGGWDKLRSQLIAQLTAQKNYALLTKIHLDEKEIDHALESVKQIGRNYFFGTNLQIDVARAAEKAYPLAATDIYRRLAEELIDAHGRNNYRYACGHLNRIHELYLRIGQKDEWCHYIEDLKERNRNLRALKEEMTKTGL
jgi:uncharacterized Zn finger protein